MKKPLFAFLALVVANALTAATEKKITDLAFATVGDTPLRLDLYLPETGVPAGLIIWVHGGAWRAGSRSSVDLKGMVAHGWAVASVDYRFPRSRHSQRRSTTLKPPSVFCALMPAITVTQQTGLSSQDLPPVRIWRRWSV